MTALRHTTSVISFTILLLFGKMTFGQQAKPVHYPGAKWEVVAAPEELGLSREKLEEAKAYSNTIQTDAVMIVVDGKVAYQWGDVDKKINTHSVRKSVMSAVYGKYVKNGTISLDATMEDLKIDDVEGLSKTERKATVRDLLKARSGVYHPALYETKSMRNRKPKRHAHKPGTFYYYNNWDFNVLGTILKQETGKQFFTVFYEDIAQPIGMEDYQPSDGNDVSGKASIHHAYPFHITAQDLARFGWLMLNNGRWNNKQVIDSAWVKESTQSYSDTHKRRYGYGYLWWIPHDPAEYTGDELRNLPAGSYSAHGAKGQFLMVIPAYHMVVVHRTNSDIRGRAVTGGQWSKLLSMILDARINNER